VEFVVGLGNPGPKYARTRHNVGFAVIELLAERWNLGSPRPFMGALCWRGTRVLVQPQCYMNLSGDPVGRVVRYYDGDPAQVIVIHDELDLQPGTVRVKSGGGHGGHNGLRSIVAHLGPDFARVRIGVGKPPDPERGADFVLSRFALDERAKIDEALAHAADAVEDILALGVRAAMNRWNQR
jgi:PTH1 family peptidyl-tRNA hydrolase